MKHKQTPGIDPIMNLTNQGDEESPDLLEESYAIYKSLRFENGPIREAVLPLVEGYTYISQTGHISESEFSELMATLVAIPKTVIIEYDPKFCPMLARFAETHNGFHKIIGVTNKNPCILSKTDHLYQKYDRFFIIPEHYISRRIASQQVRRANPQHALDNLPIQKITFVGVSGTVSEKARAFLHKAKLIVTFNDEMVRPYTTAPIHLLQYDPACYKCNVTNFDNLLRDLHHTGHYDITFVLTGTAQVFDIPERMELYNRTLHFIDTCLPVSVSICMAFAQSYRARFMDVGYVLCSGYFERYGLDSASFQAQLSNFLSTGLPCILSEMFYGDVIQVLAVINNHPSAKHLLMFENIYTANQRITFFSHQQLQSLESIELTSKKVTLCIVDENMLPKTLGSA